MEVGIRERTLELIRDFMAKLGFPADRSYPFKQRVAGSSPARLIYLFDFPGSKSSRTHRYDRSVPAVRFQGSLVGLTGGVPVHVVQQQRA